MRPVQVHGVVVGGGKIPRSEACQWIGRHVPGRNRNVQRFLQLLQRAHANGFFSVFRAPEGQRNTPVPRTAQIPIVQRFQPISKPTGSRAGRFPLDGVVQGLHAFFDRGGANEPAVQRVVQDRLVRSPAVRVTVHVLLNFERLVFCFQLDGDFFVHAQFGRLFRGVVGVFDKFSGPRAAGLRQEPPAEVHQRDGVTVFVQHQQRRHSGGGGHPGVVRAKSGSRVHHARAVFRGHKITRNHAKSLVCVFVRQRARQQLLVAQAHQSGAQVCAASGPNRTFLLRFEIIGHQSGGQHHLHRRMRVGVFCGDAAVFNVRAHRQRRIGRQGPRGGGPGQKVHGGIPKKRPALVRWHHGKLRRNAGVCNVFVATGLVQLVGAQTGTRGG